MIVRVSGEGQWRVPDDRQSALKLYLFSLAYLALLFAAMVADAKI